MSRVFNGHTDAFERLIIFGALPSDHIQRADYDYSTDLKVELQKRDREEREGQRPIPTHTGKPLGKHLGKVRPRKAPIPSDLGKPISVGELLKSRANAEWIVDSFGAKGALVSLAADVGTGKTTFLYSLASCIVKGEPFLKNKDGIGQLTTKKSRVLFVQADEPKNDCWRKCKIMGLTPDAFDFVFSEDGFNSLDLPRLERLIDEGGYGVVMLDSVTTLLANRGVSIKDPEFAKPLYDLNNLASRKNILIVITSHLRKPEHQQRGDVSMFDILGAGTQVGAVSDVWAISRAPNSTPKQCQFVLSCLEKARNCEVGTCWNLEGNKEDLSWVFESVTGEEELLPSVKKDLRSYAELYLSESEEWRTIEEVAIHFGKNKEHTRAVLMDLFVEEVIERKKQKLGIEVGGRPKWVYRGKRGFPRCAGIGM